MSEIQYTHEQIESAVRDEATAPTREHMQSLYAHFMEQKTAVGKLQKVVTDLDQFITSYHPQTQQEEVLRDLLYHILVEHGLRPPKA